MKKHVIVFIAVAGIIISSPLSALAGGKPCAEADKACREFAALADAEQFDRITAQAGPAAAYSEEAKAIIGQAYLAVAGSETNTPSQEEYFCLKALEYGATSAYMGLYFIHAGQNEEKALGYLRLYVATKPKDGVPYVLLGEAEMEKENFEAANEYFREAKSVARGQSANLDWALFQVSYLIGDFEYASSILDTLVSRGQFTRELKDLTSDPRFADIKIRAEFRKYEPLISGTISIAAL